MEIKICRQYVVFSLLVIIFLGGCKGFRNQGSSSELQGWLVLDMDSTVIDWNGPAIVEFNAESRLELVFWGYWRGYLGVSWNRSDLGIPVYIYQKKLNAKDLSFTFDFRKLACSWEVLSKEKKCETPDYLRVAFSQGGNFFRRPLRSSVKFDFSNWSDDCHCSDKAYN